MSLQNMQNHEALCEILTEVRRLPALTNSSGRSSAENNQEDRREGVNSPTTSHEPREGHFANVIGVSAAIHATQKCASRVCRCQCHRKSNVRPFNWISNVAGTLLIGYSGISNLFMPKVECTEKACQRQERGQLKVTYYFPSWFTAASRAISYMDSWNSLDGHQVFWKFPRVVPANADLFVFAQKGNIKGVQRLIEAREASIYDVSDMEGRSALHVSLSVNASWAVKD